MMLWPLVMLMQVGADPHVYPQAPLPAIAPRLAPAAVPPSPTSALADCAARGRDDADAGLGYARDWLVRAQTADARAQANQCLGLILSDQGEFGEAQAAFAAAVEAIPASRAATAAPVMAMAGNAALADGDATRALSWFDRALAVREFDNPAARGGVLADRARALVALGRTAEAAGALAEARIAAPGDAGVFLLSATLARRGHDLAAAQGFIETAASLDPRDPAIGLEAGVIAVLAGHEAAARQSWNSVLATAPDSAEAKTARDYLAQLGPDSALAPDPPATTTGGRHQ